MLPEILCVGGADGGRVLVPLTPLTTFRDVAACVRDPGDPLPTLLEHSPLGVRVVSAWERPLELLRLWSGLKDQVSYTASYSAKDDLRDVMASPSKSYSSEDEDDRDRINPWELYDLKDELKGIGDRAEFRWILEEQALSHSLDDSDDLMAVSSDGEADTSYNSHTRGNITPVSRPTPTPHSRFTPFSLPVPPFYHPGVANGRGGRWDVAADRRSFRHPAAVSFPRGRTPSFLRGLPHTSSLPPHPQDLLQASNVQQKKHIPQSAPVPRQAAAQHRKRSLTRTRENDIVREDWRKGGGGSSIGPGTMSTDHQHHLNSSLSPIMSRKQKLTPAEYKQWSSRSGWRRGGVEDLGLNHGARSLPVPAGLHGPGAGQGRPTTRRRAPPAPPITVDLRPRQQALPASLPRHGARSVAPPNHRGPSTSQPHSGTSAQAGDRGGEDQRARRDGVEGRERVSRRTAGPRTAHRRSYSDPLYEYLHDPRTLAMRGTRTRRHSGGSALEGDGVMRNSHAQLTLLPDGCELTVGELRDMASRQQQQIETQQQLLVAREQRLKYLKQQESRAAAVAAEAERLRRLRERVEAQEAKLRRLRALRGQVEATRLNTASLTTDLDAMRHLFSEKEKELVVAVGKVEELTRQLEELRHGRSPLAPNNHHHNELDKLRRELLYRNSVNREASARVAAQRETLAARRDEITRIDKRVSELQQRLHRKRLLNHQLASQITAATQAKQAQLKAVQQKALREGVHTSSSVDDAHTTDHLKIPHGEELGEFGPNKSDPKYQTLPYNTKFSVTAKAKPGESDSAPTTPTSAAPPTSIVPSGELSSSLPTTTVPTELTGDSGQPGNNSNGNSSVVTRTVHSIPMHLPSRGLAHAPIPALPQQQQQQQPQQAGTGPIKQIPNPAMTPRVYGQGALQFNQRSQPLGGAALPLNQKLSPGVTAHSQSRSLLLPSLHTQDVEGVGGGGNSESVEEGMVIVGEGGRHKPALPPKPAVPTKPQPPPRQKGDPLAGSPESLTTAQAAARAGQSRVQPGYRYASQNVIVSTYTQQAAGPDTGDTTDDNARLKTTPVLAATTTSNNNNNNNNNSNNNNNNNNNNTLEVGGGGGGGEKVHVSINRRIEMPPDFMFPEDETPPSDLLGRHISEIENGEATGKENGIINESDNRSGVAPCLPLGELEKLRIDKEDRGTEEDKNAPSEDARQPDGADTSALLSEEGHKGEGERTTTTNLVSGAARRLKKGNLKNKNSSRVPRRVSFDPLALLLDASLEGELELVRRTATEVPNPSAANDEGITALHNAICAGHLDIVTFLVTFGCNVNAQDSDGWTPLHCAASCNNVAMVRFLVEHGACILATTLSDHETPAEKCEQDEEGYDGCSQYLYSVQEKLGIMNGGLVYAVYDYEGEAGDELNFQSGDGLTILRRGDEYEREWWWGQRSDTQGYIPRNLLGLYPRVNHSIRDS